MAETVYIICQYNEENSGRQLNTPPAGITYVKYIIKSIKATGRGVSILSTATGTFQSYFSTKKILVDNKESHIYLSTLKQSGYISLRIGQLLCYIQLLFFFLFKISKNDKIVLCHDRGISVFYSFARKLIRRQYYYFIGEIFSAVYDKGDKAIKSEIETIKGVDGYILINNLMPRLLGGISNYCVCHGSYEPPRYNISTKQDDLIHVVYAGKIAQKDVTDAFIAVAASEYLDNRYRVHILGYGEQEDLHTLKNKIDEINSKRSAVIVSYDGCLFGEEYERFLLGCDIGLCTRALTGFRANLCFPSKTLVYLAHGLNIVAPNIEVLKTSNISNYISYLEGELTPKNVAKAIMEIKISDRKGKNDAINKLGNDFVRSLNVMLSYER